MKGLLVGLILTIILLLIHGGENFIYYSLPIGILTVLLSTILQSKKNRDTQIPSKISSFCFSMSIPLVLIPLFLTL